MHTMVDGVLGDVRGMSLIPHQSLQSLKLYYSAASSTSEIRARSSQWKSRMAPSSWRYASPNSKTDSTYRSGRTFHDGMEGATEMPGIGRFSGMSTISKSSPVFLQCGDDTRRVRPAPTYKKHLKEIMKCQEAESWNEIVESVERDLHLK